MLPKKILIFLIGFYFIPISIYSIEGNLKFRNIDIDNGLSNNSITCIYKDTKGFVWIGTQDGLNVYDGYDFRVFSSYNATSYSLNNNLIKCIFEDSKQNIWVGTIGGGINLFNSSTQTFTYYLSDTLDDNSISSNHVFDIVEDDFGAIWIATGNGLNKFDTATQSFSHFFYNADSVRSRSEDYLLSLTIDKQNKLWVGTYGGGVNIIDIETGQISKCHFISENIKNHFIWDVLIDSDGLVWFASEKNGLNVYDPETKQTQRFLKEKGNYDFINSNYPVDIEEDRTGMIWITTDRGGLYSYNKKTLQFLSYKNDPTNAETLPSNVLTKAYIDNDNLLWIGTYDKGLSLSNLNQKNIQHINQILYDANSISDKNINCIYEDSEGEVWVATENGLNRTNKQFDAFTVYSLSNKMNNNVGLAVMETSFGEIWIGTYTGGINVYNKQNDSFKYYTHRSDDSTSLSSDFVRVIFEDSKHLMWIGTVRGGLDKYDPKTKRFTHYSYHLNNAKSVNSTNIMSIIEDDDHNIRLATFGGGINIFNRETNSFSFLMHDGSQRNTLSDNQCICQFIDSKGNYWVGTNYGLNKMNDDGTTFKQYFKGQGLPNNTILGILEDHNGDLWITTKEGLSKYDQETETFSNFFKEDGLQSDVYIYNSLANLSNGKLAFGGVNGLSVFNPDLLEKNNNTAKVFFTSLSVLNKEIKIGAAEDGRQLFSGSLVDAKEVNLLHSDKLFSLHYSTLEYKNPKQITYQYKIDKLHSDWIDLGNKNYLSFHNLPPGNYTLHIRSGIHDEGRESQETTLKINIKPPFYATNWFIIGVVILLLGLAIIIYYRKSRNAKLQQALLKKLVEEKTQKLKSANDLLSTHRVSLENEVKERTADLLRSKEKAERSDALKSAFLANMSHEIRTPMNAILGFIGLLEFETDEEQIVRFKEMISSSGMTLMRLIDDIIDLSRIEAGDVSISKTHFNFTKVVNDIAEIFDEDVKKSKKDIVWASQPSVKELIIFSDITRVKQVIVNLLNNALKFTDKGSISIDYYLLDENTLFCSVKDSGIGISSQNLDSIFSRFRKVEDDIQKLYRGAGLGLAISKELVELLGGSIGVESKIGEGTMFYFTIAINE